MDAFSRQLVKLALNVPEMRVLARKMGIVPDPATRWKWALRQVTDVKDKAGNVLKKGKTLEQLGDSPRALRGKIEAEALRGDSPVETGARWATGRARTSPVVRGTKMQVSTARKPARLADVKNDSPRAVQSYIARHEAAPNTIHAHVVGDDGLKKLIEADTTGAAKGRAERMASPAMEQAYKMEAAHAAKRSQYLHPAAAQSMADSFGGIQMAGVRAFRRAQRAGVIPAHYEQPNDLAMAYAMRRSRDRMMVDSELDLIRSSAEKRLQQRRVAESGRKSIFSLFQKKTPPRHNKSFAQRIGPKTFDPASLERGTKMVMDDHVRAANGITDLIRPYMQPHHDVVTNTVENVRSLNTFRPGKFKDNMNYRTIMLYNR